MTINTDQIFAKLRNKDMYYYDLADYIDKKSNEITFDEVWVWRIFDQLSDKTGTVGIPSFIVPFSDEELSYLLKEIFIQIIQKGGKLVDNNLQENREHHQFEEKMKKGDLSYIDDLVDFLIKNPHYGENGGGFWFL